MKDKKNMILIILLVILIAINIFFERKNMEFSSDPNDNKLVDSESKFKLEEDDNKFQIINDCFENFYNFSDMDDKSLIKSISTTSKSNVDNFSIQKIYKVEKNKKSLSYVEIYEISNNKLSVNYYYIKLNYEKYTYFISNSNKDTFNNAIQNKVEKDFDFDNNLSENSDTTSFYNLFNYNSDYKKIAYRYINDYFIKYNYSKNDVKQLLLKHQNPFEINKVNLNDIMSLDRQINDNNITYKAFTIDKTYEINVYSPQNYKISIK